MDIEFVVQDTYNHLRPQWKLVLNDVQEASRVFGEACKQNYQDTASGKTAEPEEPEEPEAEVNLSDDEHRDGDENAADGDATHSGSDDDKAQGDDDEARANEQSDEEEHIVVTRPEDHRDPEADAEFDRELAKLMAESVDSRKFERKTMFDVPLPMRRTVRDATTNAAEGSGDEATAQPQTNGAGTMKFALLSKKGNRQQTRSIDMPSDSAFAVAMRSQQEAERAEQQRIKNLVLNYDLTNDQEDGAFESLHNGPRYDKSGNTRSKQRARKLQLGDIDWT